MIIAEQKKKENIIEYIIYLRQIQDLIRSLNFDFAKIKNELVDKYNTDSETKLRIENWYRNIAKELTKKNFVIVGDIDEIKNTIALLEDLHQKLLKDTQEHKHKELYKWAEPNIANFRTLSRSPNKSDVEVCIDAVYSLFLLRLKKEPISEETMQAMQTFINLLTYIARKYHGIE